MTRPAPTRQSDSHPRLAGRTCARRYTASRRNRASALLCVTRRTPARLLSIVEALAVASCVIAAGCRGESEQMAVALGTAAEGAIATTTGAGGPGARPARLRRMWAGGDFNFYASSPSLDGRFVSEIDWFTGDLAVRDLSTGRLHHLTDKGSWDVSSDYAEVSRFSPDGRRLAYDWFNDATKEYEIRVINFSVDETGTPHGSNPRVVYPGGELFPYWLYGWTSNDEILTGVYRPDRTFALAFVSVSTGELRVLKSFDWRDARAVVSADGMLIAYDHPPGKDSRDRDIYLLSADGQRETTLVSGPARDEVLGWVPGESSLLFYSDRSGLPAIWRLPVADGRAAGPPELLRDDVRNLESLGFAGGTFYFGVTVETPAFRTAVVDLDGHQLIEQPAEFDAPDGGMVRSLAWSPNGQLVIHDATAPAGTRIYVRSADGEIINDWLFDIHVPYWLIRWAPDGKSIMLPAADDQGRLGIYRIVLESGQLEPVWRYGERPGRVSRWFSISPDGMRIFYARAPLVDGEIDEDNYEIVARDLVTGEERPIHHVESRGRVEVSPDGASLAYFEDAPNVDPALKLYPVDGGEPRVLYRPDVGHIDAIVGWTPDGRTLLFKVSRSRSAAEAAAAGESSAETSIPIVEVWRVSAQGGDAERIAELRDPSQGGIALHPDGRTIAYRAGRTRGEIWALDDFSR